MINHSDEHSLLLGKIDGCQAAFIGNVAIELALGLGRCVYFVRSSIIVIESNIVVLRR